MVVVIIHWDEEVPWVGMSLGGSEFGRAGGVFGRAELLEFGGWHGLRICCVLVSRMEIEKHFAMTNLIFSLMIAMLFIRHGALHGVVRDAS